MKLNRILAGGLVVVALVLVYVLRSFLGSEPAGRGAVDASQPSRPAVSAGEADLAVPGSAGKPGAAADRVQAERAVGETSEQARRDGKPGSLRVVGTITDSPAGEGTRPVNAAGVVLQLLDANVTWERETLSGAPGDYVFEFPLDLGVTPQAVLRVGVSAAGHEHQTLAVPLAKALQENPRGELRLDFELGVPAPFLRGRVLNEDGAGVGHASVLGFGDDGVSVVVRSTTDAVGEYVLTSPDVPQVLLSAHHFQHGIGRLFKPVEIALGDTRAPDIVLRAGLSLAGRALLPDGEPAAGVRLRAHPADVLPGRGTSFGIHPPERSLQLDGLPCGMAETDAEGRFVFRGLADGEYALEAGADDDTLAQGSSGPYTAGTAGEQEIEVVVERYRVFVHVFAAGTGGTPGVRIGCRSWREPGADLLAAIESGSVLRERGRRPEERQNGNFLASTAELAARAGDVLRIEGSAPGFRSAHAVIQIEPETYAYDVALELTPLLR